MSKFTILCCSALCVCLCEKLDAGKFSGSIQEKEVSMENIKEVSAKHILVGTEKEAKDLLGRINSGEISFEEAAAQFSQCPSKNDGGNLGFFGRGSMVKEFEEAAFSTKVGQISQPVKTQFGWHLIKVEEVR